MLDSQMIQTKNSIIFTSTEFSTQLVMQFSVQTK